MSERPEIFQGVSSLVDDFDATVDGAWFGKNPRFAFEGKMNVLLNINLIGDQLDEAEWVPLSIGDGWSASPDKSTVTLDKPRSNGKIGFGDSTNLMKWVDRLFELDEAAVLSRYEDTGFGPDNVHFWDGLTSHFVREQTPKQKADGKPGNLMPTGFIAWGETAPTEKPKKRAAKKKAAAPPQKAETNGEGVIDEAILKRIDEIADGSETHDQFIATVFGEIPDAADEPLYGLVMEGEDVEGSIWQRAFARAPE